MLPYGSSSTTKCLPSLRITPSWTATTGAFLRLKMRMERRVASDSTMRAAFWPGSKRFSSSESGIAPA